MMQNMKANFLETELQARGNIVFTFAQRAAGLARRSKDFCKLIGEDTTDYRRTEVPGHLHAFSMVTKVVECQPELSVLFRANDVSKLFNESWRAVRGKSHHLSLVAIVWKTEKLGRRG